MPVIANDRKVAVLLSAIGGEAAQSALATLSAEKAGAIRQAIDEMKDHPPSDQECGDVLDDFERFFRFALETANVPATWMEDLIDKEKHPRGNEKDRENSDHDEEADDMTPPPRPVTLKIFTPTDDPYYDLRRLKPVQLARALRVEQPKTIALVMNHLSREQTSEIIQNLPEALQAAVILEIGNKPEAPDFLIDKIVLETVRMASGVSDTVTKEPDVNDQLAEMLRSMPKNSRARIMDEIRENNPERAEMIASRLYVFEDLVTYDDRSIQKLLREIDSATLIAALQGAAEDIRDLTFNNLSKRARGSILEEMELSPQRSADEVMQARQDIAAAIARLDREGQFNTR